MKIAAGIEYCGSRFSGWQRQKHAQGIQELVENALSVVGNEKIHVQCAGRTDTGVHALHQVIHFESLVQRQPHSWVFGANANLDSDITILWSCPVAGDFHARFSARGRRYRYLILNRDTRPGINNGLTAWEYRELNVEQMSAAARFLVGEHDFTSFRGGGCQAKSPVREVRELTVGRRGEYIVIDIHANAFLMHMVRNIVGVLTSVGMGRHEPGWAQTVLSARDREKGGVTAPPQGLYLMDIDYPEKFGIPRRSTPAWPQMDYTTGNRQND